MATLLQILMQLALDDKEFKKGLDEAEKTAKKKGEGIGKSLSSVGDSMMKVGAGMTAGITLPIAMAAKSSIDAASDLSETVSKVGVVFGETSEQVLKFGENAATAMGMSKNEALGAAGTFGNLFRAMEMSEQTSADMSTTLVQLSADLASFNNMDPTEVMDKLRAGISGESEPLKSLGVNINQAMVEAKALEMGLMSLTGELTPAAAAQARYALIMEQTGLAQGDFARTSDGLANQSRILKAQLADVSAELGENLLPFVVKLVSGLNTVVSAFAKLPEPVQNNILVLLGLLAAAGPVLTVVGGIMKAVAALQGAWAALAPVMSGAGTILAGLSLPVIALIAAIGLLIGVIIVFGKDAWNTVTMIGKIFEVTFGGLIKRNIEVLVAAIEGIGRAIQGVIGWIGNLASSFMSLRIPDWLTPGSPTPFELGLRGINNEMKRVVDGVLPSFSAEFAMQGTGAAPAPQQAAPAFDYDRLAEAVARAVKDAVVQVTG